MKKDFEKDFLNGAGRNELSAEDQAFIRLLREKAEDTPVADGAAAGDDDGAAPGEAGETAAPVAAGSLCPGRFQSGGRAGGICCGFGGRQRPRPAVSLKSDIPMEPSSGISESLPEDPSSEPGALPIAPDETSEPSSDAVSEPAENNEPSQPSENSRPADNSASAGGTSGSVTGSSTVTGDASSETETSDTCRPGTVAESGDDSGSSSSGLHPPQRRCAGRNHRRFKPQHLLDAAQQLGRGLRGRLFRLTAGVHPPERGGPVFDRRPLGGDFGRRPPARTAGRLWPQTAVISTSDRRIR